MIEKTEFFSWLFSYIEFFPFKKKKALVRASRRLLDSAPRRANINDDKFKKAKLAHLASAKFNIFIDVDFSVLLIKKQSLIIQVLFEKKSKFKQKKN